MSNTMKGLFFIVKGQYRKDTSPRVTNEDGKTYSLGGYDPECEDTVEHYQLMDNITFKCLSCGTLNDVLKSLERIVKRHKGKVEHYLKGVKKLAPVSHSELFIRQHVYEEYGDYYEYEVSEVVDRVLKGLVNQNYKRAKRLVKTIKTPNSEDRVKKSTFKKVTPVLRTKPPRVKIKKLKTITEGT